MDNQRFRLIPDIQKLLETDAVVGLCTQYSRTETLTALRSKLDAVRLKMKQNESYQPPDFSSSAFFEAVRDDIELMRESSLVPVINATGIIVHTNLGRAPLAEAAIDAIREAALGYSNLEFDLDTGKRGSRYRHVESLLTKLTGAEAAVVVNNCAAAVLVSLNTLCNEKEAICSRGELVEIGGGFRMPDVITATGAKLREVGTTNKTRIADYEQAINENSGVILRNHCSNFKVIGFTEQASLVELVELAHSRDLYMVDDLGSGALVDLVDMGVKGESSVQEIVASGVDAVMFSGDKLLGGPQAGIILGKEEVINKIKSNPLLRALRIDKLSLAALEATLAMYLVPETSVENVPVLRMAAQDLETMRTRTENFLTQLSALSAIDATIEEAESFIGGGSAPMNELPTTIIKIRSENYSAEVLAERLRSHKPAVVARITDNAIAVDLRTVMHEQEEDLRLAIEAVA